MKKKLSGYALPVFTLLLGMLLSGAISSAATLSAPSAFSGGNAIACYSSAASNVSVSMGGRSISPNSLLSVPSSASCPAGETALGLAAYSRTVLVSPKDTGTNSGTALLDALATIQAATPAPASASPYLLKLEPGVYDLGTQSLTMLPYVDLEGSGEGTTTVTSAVNSTANSPDPTSGTLNGANNSEMRFLKIVNTSSSNVKAAIYNNGLDKTARISHLTAITSGAGSGTFNYGIYNTAASPTIQSSTFTAANGNVNFGIFNAAASSPTIQTSSGSAIGTGGPLNFGMYNLSSSPTVQNGTFTTTGVDGYNAGIYNNASSFTIQNSTVTATGGANNFGFFNYDSSTATIQNSTIKGVTDSIANQSGTIKIAASELDGPVGSLGTLTCVASYKADFSPVNANCA